MGEACDDCGNAVLRTASWLSLAAAPTFAIMALLSALPGDGSLDVICSHAHDASPLGAVLNGMVAMYVLMSAFHMTPWLIFISLRRRRPNAGL